MDLDISEITATSLQDEITGPIILDENREQVTKRRKYDKNMKILAVLVDLFSRFSNCFKNRSWFGWGMILDWF